MSKYKIHIDQDLPKSTELKRHKSFDTLYDTYRSKMRYTFWKNLWRNPKYFAPLLLILAVGFLVFNADNEQGQAKALLNKSQLPWQDLSLSTSPTEIGSYLKLSTEADKLDLRFLALNDAADYMIAGIPSWKIKNDKDQPLTPVWMAHIEYHSKDTIKMELHIPENLDGGELFYFDRSSYSWVSRGAMQDKGKWLNHTITQSGVWCVAFPGQDNPNNTIARGIFTDEALKKNMMKGKAQLYLVSEDKRLTKLETEGKEPHFKFGYDPDKKNLIWIIDKQKEIHKINAEDFASTFYGKKEVVPIAPQHFTKDLNDYKQLKKWLLDPS